MNRRQALILGPMGLLSCKRERVRRWDGLALVAVLNGKVEVVDVDGKRLRSISIPCCGGVLCRSVEWGRIALALFDPLRPHSSPGKLCVLDVKGTVEYERRIHAIPSLIALSSDGMDMAVAQGLDGQPQELVLYSQQGQRLERLTALPQIVDPTGAGLRFTFDKRSLLFCNGRSILTLDLATRKVDDMWEGRFPTPSENGCIAFTRGNKVHVKFPNGNVEELPRTRPLEGIHGWIPTNPELLLLSERVISFTTLMGGYRKWTIVAMDGRNEQELEFDRVQDFTMVRNST